MPRFLFALKICLHTTPLAEFYAFYIPLVITFCHLLCSETCLCHPINSYLSYKKVDAAWELPCYSDADPGFGQLGPASDAENSNVVEWSCMNDASYLQLGSRAHLKAHL